MSAPLTVKILAAFEMKEIVRRDGTSSFLQEFIIGDASGTARLVSWSPELFADVDVGSCVSISGVQRKEDEGIIEYVVSDSAEIRILPDEIPVLSKDASEVSEGPNPIVTGVVTSVSEIRSFITRRGTESRVRNVAIRGSAAAGSVNVAIWGDAADTLFLPGDSVQVINAAAKLNRYGELELSVGRGSVIQTIALPGENISVTGMVILRPEGLSLDDGKEVWILITDQMPEPGVIVEVDGVSQNGRIKVTNINPHTPDPAPLVSRLEPLL
jgi:replication factor A1